MTDNEIIKALESCNALVKMRTCKTCPLYTFEGCCTAEMLRQTVDLITRQKAEIDRLNRDYSTAVETMSNSIRTIGAEKEALIAGLETLQKALAEKDAEINNLNDLVVYNVSCATKLHIKLADSKSEAVKEFENFLINNLIREQFSREYVISLIRYYAKERSSE